MENGTRLIPREKNNDEIRFLSFNVNGIKTFFQYHPFNKMNNSLDAVFESFGADIVTFQELKTSKDNIQKYGKVHHYHSFITLSKKKMGYSGVGCWIRKINSTSHPLYNLLQVVKAEEGITGYLEVTKPGNSKSKQFSSRTETTNTVYRDDASNGIGGYDGIDEIYDNDISRALELDSQGRCVIVELSCGLVIFSCYCPANSMATDDGELFRMQFLQVLFKRAKNLVDMGKKVVIMGDINVCKDLIDSADYLENESSIKDTSNPSNTREMVKFINESRPSRLLMNNQLKDSLDSDCSKKGFLYDSTRLVQGYDRMTMYTVWNTLLNCRPMNYGSRVDYIFVSDFLNVKGADILPNVLGSDHCPIYTDIQVSSTCDALTQPPPIPKFECKFHYRLISSNILDMFSKRKVTDILDNNIPRNGVSKVTKKTTPPKKTRIDSFFKTVEKKVPLKKEVKPYKGLFVQDEDDSESEDGEGLPSATQHPFLLGKKEDGTASSGSNNEDNNITQTTPKVKPKFTIESSELGRKIIAAFGNVPKCKHSENAVLRTSKTQNNFGKKFWVCGKPRGADPNDPNSSCGFFQWH